jgi:gamma-glutamylcyclotransferase (GGCT)/AIG2-like uncharacterized protein YtfP
VDVAAPQFHLHYASPLRRQLSRVTALRALAVFSEVGKVDALFVYGTLMQGGRLHRHVAAAHPTLLLPAMAAGRLIDLGAYPGMIAAAAATDRVRGEYLEFASLASFLPRLDRIEGQKYRRVRIDVEVAALGSRTAWGYLWVGEVCSARLIPSGDWRNR